MRLVYWNNVTTPYMSARWKSLAERTQLEVWVNRSSAASYEWGPEPSAFRLRILPNVRIAGHRLAVPVGMARKQTRPDALIMLYGEPSFVLGALLAYLTGTPTVYWCEATSASHGPRRRYREFLKRRMFSRAYMYLSPGADADNWIAGYVPSRRNRVHRLEHVIDHELFAGAVQDDAGRAAWRQTWGLQDTDAVLLFVGRFVRGKGIDLAIRALAGLPANTHLCIVGSGPELLHLRALAFALSIPTRVHFVSFKQQSELVSVYAAADVFVLPTLGDTYGLVIDEALAAGLPVVSTTGAGEVRQRLTAGQGLIVAQGSDEALRLGIAEVLTWKRSKPARTLRSRRVAHLTPDYWADSLMRTLTESGLGKQCG